MREILYLEDDKEQRELGKTYLETKLDREIDTKKEIGDTDLGQYKVVISDYRGINIDQVYKQAENTVVFTAHQESFIDIPEDVEYFKKGSSYDKLAETVEKHLEKQ